jgi:hypothetical protein
MVPEAPVIHPAVFAVFRGIYQSVSRRALYLSSAIYLPWADGFFGTISNPVVAVAYHVSILKPLTMKLILGMTDKLEDIFIG